MNFIVNIFKHLFSNPATRMYPFVKRESFELSRGHVEIDILSCIFCGVCSRKCPADAIVVVKSPKSWTIDPYRCVLCAACVDACPKKCLYMKNEQSYPVIHPDARIRNRHLNS